MEKTKRRSVEASKRRSVEVAVLCVGCVISCPPTAQDKLRFTAVSNPDALKDDPNMGIKIRGDPVAKTLTVEDTGRAVIWSIVPFHRSIHWSIVPFHWSTMCECGRPRAVVYSRDNTFSRST